MKRLFSQSKRYVNVKVNVKRHAKMCLISDLMGILAEDLQTKILLVANHSSKTEKYHFLLHYLYKEIMFWFLGNDLFSTNEQDELSTHKFRPFLKKELFIL